MAEHHLSACQHCQYIPSSPSHHLSLPLTTSQPRTVPVSTLNGTPASSRHFLSSHINNFKSPNPPATNSPDVHRPLLHHAVHHPMATRKDPKAEPTSRTHHCPSTLPATPAAIGQCTALPIPGREACVSAGTFAPTAPREKHQGSCALASPPVGSLCLRNIPSAIAWDGGNARAMVQQWCGAAAGSRSRFLW